MSKPDKKVPPPRPMEPVEGSARNHFGDSRPKSMFNRIAESGMNFVRNVLDGQSDVQEFDLGTGLNKSGGSQSAQQSGFVPPHAQTQPEIEQQGEFQKEEVSVVAAYEPNWRGGQPEEHQIEVPEEFTKFNSAINAWNKQEAHKAAQRPRRRRAQGVIVVQQRKSRGLMWFIITLMVAGGLGVGGMYAYKHVSSRFVDVMKKESEKKNSSEMRRESSPKKIKKRKKSDRK